MTKDQKEAEYYADCKHENPVVIKFCAKRPLKIHPHPTVLSKKAFYVYPKDAKAAELRPYQVIRLPSSALPEVETKPPKAADDYNSNQYE